MKIPELLEQVTGSKNALVQASRLLGYIHKLDLDRALNLLQIKAQVEKLEILARENAADQRVFQAIQTWLEQYKQEINTSEEGIKAEFGLDLEKELKKAGYTLSGHLPVLAVGIFKIEVDFPSWSVKLWYGPKQELLGKCAVSASEVSRRLLKLRSQLGSKLDEQGFIQLLSKACTRKEEWNSREPVPIIKVMGSVSEILKENYPVQNEKGKAPVYGRADFSYDLFRTRNASSRPHLVIATRAFTNHRVDFLWIPTDESGDGSDFSHLKLPEVKNE